MFHSLLLTSIAILGVGDDLQPQNWKNVVADLNRQLTEAKKQYQDLAEEKKNLANALNGEKARTQKRLLALENLEKIVVKDRDEKERALLNVQHSNRVLALTVQEANKRFSVLQTLIDGMRNDIKVAVDERNSLERKLVNMTDEANTRKILFDRLAKAVRDKRYDDALKMVEESKAKEITAGSDKDTPRN